MLFFKNSSTNISLAALRIIGIEAYLFNIGFKLIAGNFDFSTFKNSKFDFIPKFFLNYFHI